MSARRPWALPLVPLYAVALAVKDALRRMHILRTRRLEWPVVSVGSLSAGGAGKTPVVIALSALLQERGWHVNVLSRGYGRKGHGVERVTPDIPDAAERFGDEPVVIAQSAWVPVWVGSDRFAAGHAAEENAYSGRQADAYASLRKDGPEAEPHVRFAHLLDDGFQHRRLARTVDIVLVTEEDLQDALLPAGNLREPLSALRRADAVVLRVTERERLEPRVRSLMCKGALLWSIRRELRFSDSQETLTARSRPVAFCAIARPENFWAMLAEAGCDVDETLGFGDHHRYEMADMDRLVALAKDCGATGFITTEKDAVKLSPAMLERLHSVGPVCVVELEARFLDEAEVARALEALCR